MSKHLEQLLAEHAEVTRRWFVKAGIAGTTAAVAWPLFGAEATQTPELEAAIARLESFLTLPDDFRDVSRGNPKPHSLSEDRKREVGLTRDTWKLEVTSDPENPARLTKELSVSFRDLMELADRHAVRFAKVMTCLNIGCPLGMGIWEGVPLREVLWQTGPKEDLRRVFYYGYHNDDPKQIFRSSLPVGRILEDLYDLPPVILCYKLNGLWLTPERGGPVRVVVPEAYGFKSVKWLTNVVLSNLPHANDTYAAGNNDVDSPLKTFAATLSVPANVEPNTAFPVTGYAQVGVSGLSKVQVWLHNTDEELPSDDPHFARASWRDAEILPPPRNWGGGVADERIPPDTIGFNDQTPETWPMKLAKVHWAILHPGLPAGKYTLRSRTVDAHGHGQPLPRPFRKSGHSAIESVPITVSSD